MTHTKYLLLCETANKCNESYYKHHISLISDIEFDNIIAMIEEAEAQHPEWVTPASPTQHVGSDLGSTPVAPSQCSAVAPLKEFAKADHAIPMLSTAKVKKVEDLVKWMQKTAKKTGDDIFTIEWKYDGLSCSLIYQDGQLVRAATRGNGDTGDDVTAHARLMPTIPNEIPLKGRVEVRGEVVMPFAAFNKWNEEHPNDRLANPRNAASGSLKSLDPNVVVERGLEFYAYDLMLDGTQEEPIKIHDFDYDLYEIEQSYKRSLLLARSIGFTLMRSDCALTGDYYGTITLKAHGDNIASFVSGIIVDCERVRPSLPVAVDGLVIKINDTTKREMLGRTEHHPHYLVAYKFGAPTYETVLRNVEYTIGEKTGKRTPVAHFDPVVINGATITKASCGSEATWEKKNLQIGDRILVCLSNDVIPQVVGKAE